MTDAAEDVVDVERYEQLRLHALGGEPSSVRLGLALLERRGVAAWARTWRSTTHPASRPAPHRSRQPVAVGDELVAALASLALARVAAG
jgi:hypothetical protein